jgi:hypothetical protein
MIPAANDADAAHVNYNTAHAFVFSYSRIKLQSSTIYLRGLESVRHAERR